MKSFKLISSIVFVVVSMLVAMSSMAAQTGLAGCKAIVGSVETAGTGGVVNNAGSIRATGAGLNIVICDLDAYQSFDKLFVRLQDSNLDSICNISSYSITGTLRGSYSQPATRLLSYTRVSFLNVIDTLDVIGPYSYQLSCRLGQGDILHGYNADDIVYRQ